jgi:hypothetical protein
MAGSSPHRGSAAAPREPAASARPHMTPLPHRQVTSRVHPRHRSSPPPARPTTPRRGGGGPLVGRAPSIGRRFEPGNFREIRKRVPSPGGTHPAGAPVEAEWLRVSGSSDQPAAWRRGTCRTDRVRSFYAAATLRQRARPIIREPVIKTASSRDRIHPALRGEPHTVSYDKRRRELLRRFALPSEPPPPDDPIYQSGPLGGLRRAAARGASFLRRGAAGGLAGPPRRHQD